MARRVRSRGRSGVRFETEGLGADVKVGEVTCVGHCGRGPNALVEASGTASVVSLAEPGALAARLAGEAYEAMENKVFPPTGDQPNFLMRWFCDKAPWSVDVARAKGAYDALAAALQAAPQAIIDEVKTSQLRGRGGAGFPAGIKLQTVRDAPPPEGTETRYVVVNADEGDAGSYIDKALLERAPHTVIEGTILAAFAVGRDRGVHIPPWGVPRRLRHLRARASRGTRRGGARARHSRVGLRLRYQAGAGAWRLRLW